MMNRLDVSLAISLFSIGSVMGFVGGIIVGSEDVIGSYCEREHHVYDEKPLLDGLDVYKCLHCKEYRKD